MATVNGITAERAQEIEDASVVSGSINAATGHLILVTAGGTEIDAGLVKPLDAAPPGKISAFATLTPPTGWLECDGSAVSRTTYAALYAALGGAASPHGQGNGTTTFNVPNYKGKVLVHRDGTQVEFDTLGETGGAKTHTLTVAEMPSHAHGGATGSQNANHNHGGTTGSQNQNHDHALNIYDRAINSGSGATVQSYSTSPTQISGINRQDHGHGFTTNNETQAHQHAIGAEGSGTAHSILQPYAVVLCCVKT